MQKGWHQETVKCNPHYRLFTDGPYGRRDFSESGYYSLHNLGYGI
jgi:hypothetical protein